MAGDNPNPADARGDVKEISDTARETIRSFEEIVWPSIHAMTRWQICHYSAVMRRTI